MTRRLASSSGRFDQGQISASSFAGNSSVLPAVARAVAPVPVARVARAADPAAASRSAQAAAGLAAMCSAQGADPAAAGSVLVAVPHSALAEPAARQVAVAPSRASIAAVR